MHGVIIRTVLILYGTSKVIGVFEKHIFIQGFGYSLFPVKTNNDICHINFHATIVLENEVSKGVMHTPKWSCMQVACTWKKWERSLWGANGGMSGEGSEIKKWVWNVGLTVPASRGSEEPKNTLAPEWVFNLPSPPRQMFIAMESRF
ncbi:hypothetical protein CK203_034571 [Vitis vinifera]|uniref:Uncharacterized protein n=1 Tax=Vitis vinifera TaxID=29760 RepID=A0A438IDR7_VITVI|nr:hypothetical protein CK203_034571 [Vitis vinifera]